MKSPELDFSKHARLMLIRREIKLAWVKITVTAPDSRQVITAEEVHYLKCIDEADGKILRVIVNEKVAPSNVITAFFDRRLRK